MTGIVVLDAADYTAGFMDSTAITNVKAAHTNEVLFQLTHVIQHSPVGTAPDGARFSASNITTTIDLNSISDTKIREVLASFDGGDPMVMHTSVNFSGDVINDLVFNGYSYSNEDLDLSFPGGRFEINSDNTKLYGSGTLGQISVNGTNGGKFTVADSTAMFDLTRAGEYTFTGTQEYSVPGISISDPQTGMSVQLNSIDLTSTADRNIDKIDGAFQLSIAEIDAPIPLNSFSWKSTVNGIDLDSVEQYQASVHELAKTPADHMDADSVRPMIASMLNIVQPGIQFNHSIALTNDGGNINGDIHVEYRDSARTIANTSTVGQLINAIKLEVDISGDTEAVDMTPLAMFMMNPTVQQYIESGGGQNLAADSITAIFKSLT